MSNIEQSNDINLTNCLVCNYCKEGMQKFPCGHLVCEECLCLILIEDEFDHENITSNISFYCPLFVLFEVYLSSLLFSILCF